jgi:cell division transport system permease protein
MTYWFRQHRYALAAALVHLRRSPGGFLFNILVVAIALALPFTGVTLLDNVRPMSEQLSVDPEISVFLKQDTPREQAEGWPCCCARRSRTSRPRSSSRRAKRRWTA